jgi:putative phosphoesterase
MRILQLVRILLIADIHSNWPALRAIQESFDACLFVGDLVDYGPDPVPCIDWVRQNVETSVRGNHDHAVAQRILPKGNTGFRKLAVATRPLHWNLIDPARNKFLARLPITARVQIDGYRFQLLHATPRDPMDEYLGPDISAWEARVQGIEADFLCVGHTHVPYEIQVGDLRVVNPGSVGQPRDGDPRASYVIIEDGQVQFKKVAYDIDETLQLLKKQDVAPWAVELTAAVLQTGGRVSPEEFDRLTRDNFNDE